MARAPKTDPHNDGMSWLALAPFPAFNPMNWWALAAPANALRAGLHASHAALDAWRASADGMRAIARAQQDAMLGMIERQLAQTGETAQQPDGAEAPDDLQAKSDSAAVAATFVAPMVEMTRAYGRFGKAFIVAQRDTMRAFTYPDKPN